jgi:hypothetical protein
MRFNLMFYTLTYSVDHMFCFWTSFEVCGHGTVRHKLKKKYFVNHVIWFFTHGMWTWHSESFYEKSNEKPCHALCPPQIIP